MVKRKDQAIIDEDVRRLELRLREDLRLGRMGLVVCGNPPDFVLHAIEESGPRLAAQILIAARARWN